MPSTYTLNNGIELIATGEQSGTWGDTTNVNLALIDTALDGQVTITLASAGSSGSPNALPISDGSASNGRNRLVIFDDGGDLGATAFVQLTPNDAEKIVYIRNNLSGGRAITLFQGTYNASNDYEVPAGTTAVVFFNGGGAGAVAANVFNNAFFDSLRLGGVSVTAILDEDNMASDSATALATQQSIKAYVDAQVGANNELSEVLANGNTSGGTNIQMTTTDEVQFRDTALTINSSVDGQLDIAADVELEIVAPTLDINASTAVTIDTTTMTMTGSVNVVGDLDVDNLNINGNSIISTNTDGNIALTPNGTGEVDISKVDIDGGTIDGTVIGGSTPAAISGTTGAFSSSGFPVVINSTNNNLFKLALQDTAATVGYIGASSAAAFAVGSSAAAELFRVSSTGLVGIGTSSPTAKLTATGLTGTTIIQALGGDSNGFADVEIKSTGSAGASRLYFSDTAAQSGLIRYGHSTDSMEFTTDGTERMRITSTGSVGVGTSSPDTYGKVVSSGGTFALVTDTSAERRLSFWSTLNGNSENAYIQVQNDGLTTNTGEMLFATKNTAGTLAERMRITQAGNVGIGTSSPAQKVDVVGGNIRVNSASESTIITNGANFTTGAVTDSAITKAGGASLLFGTGSTEQVRIDASGNVGIGTSSPENFAGFTTQTINGSTGSVLAFQNGGTAGTARIVKSATVFSMEAVAAIPLVFGTNNTERARIDASGGLLLGTTSNPNTYRAIFQGKNATTSIAGEAVLNLADGDANGDRSNIRFTTSTDGPLAVISANAVTGGSYPSSVGLLEFGVQNGGATTTAMRITSTGDVGIGTSSPAGKLDVVGTIRLTNTANAANFGTLSDGGGLVITSDNSNPMYFNTGGAERMRIDASGNLLVGTTSSLSGTSHSFLATGTTSAYYAGIFQQNGTGPNGRVQGWQLPNTNSVASYFVYATNNGGNCLNIFGNGDITNSNNSYGAISDVKVKENITDATPKLDKLSQVRVVNYNLIGDEKKHIGVIAQDLEQIFPSMVQDTPDRDAEGNDLGTTTKSVKYSVFVPMLIKAMQEQQAIIEALEARITALEA
jgi:hypothetical protein